jgi:hypothetical protein
VPSAKAMFASLGTLAVAAITLLTTFDVVDWSDSQTALVTAEAGATIGFLSAVYAHFRRATPKEPVALAATFTALVSATGALGTGFDWWDLTADEVSALVGAITATIGVGTAILARNNVTPV